MCAELERAMCFLELCRSDTRDVLELRGFQCHGIAVVLTNIGSKYTGSVRQEKRCRGVERRGRDFGVRLTVNAASALRSISSQLRDAVPLVFLTVLLKKSRVSGWLTLVRVAEHVEKRAEGDGLRNGSRGRQ